MILAYYANYPTNILKTEKKILLSGRLNFTDASHAASVTVEHFFMYATPFNMFFFYF